ncbi:MAG: hypothetical protein K2M56_07760 [Muribaculaceae bacterium]|nr:hypothetical protein [Muribaculaceae bacterium]
MKYYIPTSSLNFNNILSTESLSPKSFYEKRGFGYQYWYSVEENCIDHLTLLYDKAHMFQRPESDVEDHPMLIEIDSEDEFPQLYEGVFYTDRTIYFNPWQTKFIFFSEKDKTVAMSLSDSSLETKLVRLYQKKIYVEQFEGEYQIIKKDQIVSGGDIESLIEEDYRLNKMKGLLYGYYIGASLSSSKKLVQRLNTLREILNIFSSVLSSYEKTFSYTQRSRLNELFDYLDSQHPIYADLEKEVKNRELVDRIFSIFKRYGYVFSSLDRKQIISNLQHDAESNKAILWVNREIARTKMEMESSRIMLNPDDAEIIVSPKDKYARSKVITDNLMSNLFVSWIRDVLCRKEFNGKISPIKEILSDEITKCAISVIGAGWESCPERAYLNQLRRHVRGEEFNQAWDNGVLSSISAVLIKGDDWEDLLRFMQSKGMNDYRIAFAMYGVLNGFANMTRDFTDLLLTKEYPYLSKVYCEFYGQLLEKSIPGVSGISIFEPKIQDKMVVQKIVLMNPEEEVLNEWQNEIRTFAKSIIKRDKEKLLKSLNDALVQNGTNQDYFMFITMLDNFAGWKPGKKGPSAAWKRMQEYYVPDYDKRIGKDTVKQMSKHPQVQEIDLFGNYDDVGQLTIQERNNSDSEYTIFEAPSVEKSDINTRERTNWSDSRIGKSILKDTSWIQEWAAHISNPEAANTFIRDMNWVVDNYKDEYYDNKEGLRPGRYAGWNRSNISVRDHLMTHMRRKLNLKDDKKWIADHYKYIPIDEIIEDLSRKYGN